MRITAAAAGVGGLLTAALVGLLVLSLADSAWNSYLRRWEPPLSNPRYLELRTIRWITAPLAGGFVGGAVACALFRRRALYTALCGLCQIGVVTLWWLRPRGVERLLQGAQWPLLAVSICAGAALALGVATLARAALVRLR